jgi:integrase
MKWEQVVVQDDTTTTTIRHIVVIMEKAGQARALLLTTHVREQLARLLGQESNVLSSPRRNVLRYGVRTLRTHFYHACRIAGVEGAHCHPHSARHTVSKHFFLLQEEGGLLVGGPYAVHRW